MTEKKVYDSSQIKDAKKLADVLISVKGESRPVFALMVESMLIGAELAEKGIAAPPKKGAVPDGQHKEPQGRADHRHDAPT